MALSVVSHGPREPGSLVVLDPDGDGDYSGSALVAPWPVATPEDACGCMVRQRFEDWARAQARWLGSQAIASQAPGTAALVAASLWVAVARIQAGAGPPL
eukprot:4603558-Alexandrium_andersonii.AAC.1